MPVNADINLSFVTLQSLIEPMIVFTVSILTLAAFFYQKRNSPDTSYEIYTGESNKQPKVKTTNIHIILADLERFWRTQIDQKDLTFTTFCDPNISSFLILDPRSVYDIVSALIARAHHQTQSGRIHVHITYEVKNSKRPILKIIVADTGNGDLSPLAAGPKQHFDIFDLSKVETIIAGLDGQIDYTARDGVGAEFIVQLPAEVMENSAPDAIDMSRELDLDKTMKLEPQIAQKSLHDMGQTDQSDMIDITEERRTLDDLSGAKDDASLIDLPMTDLEDEPYTLTQVVDDPHTPALHITNEKFDSLKELKVLVVEDKSSNRHAIKAMLNPLNSQIICAVDGRQALKMLKAHQFDYIIMDVHMPKLGGIETTKIIRDNETDNVHIPIIALTADSTIKTSHEALSAGIDMVLIKPVTASSLFQAILTARDCNLAYQNQSQAVMQAS